MEDRKKQENVMRNIAVSAPILGNFALQALDREARETTLGNFESTNKKQDNSEKN
ncbi:MAG: hypothetical protein IJF45_01465 [Clostridia bacterium]|nr:hypothetical protein [Clostridia bacterium]